DPDLLILDEPTNGLDPAGIREIRDTIRELGEAGVTVLLSSHILAEVQQVCTSATIIGNGRVLASGTVEDLLSASGTTYRVCVADPTTASHHLEAAGFTVTAADDGLMVDGDRPPEEITRTLAAHDVWVAELTPVRVDLETFFLALTHDETLGVTR
ncbi:MAG: AAA family ATPase, partial [Nocardioides sp.]